jgi:hypothetical protein
MNLPCLSRQILCSGGATWQTFSLAMQLLPQGLPLAQWGADEMGPVLAPVECWVVSIAALATDANAKAATAASMRLRMGFLPFAHHASEGREAPEGAVSGVLSPHDRSQRDG